MEEIKIPKNIKSLADKTKKDICPECNKHHTLEMEPHDIWVDDKKGMMDRAFAEMEK